MSDSRYHALTLKHAPWSISKANTLETCGQQYVYRYVDKLKSTAQNEAARVGVAAHAVLEAGLRGLAPSITLEGVLQEQTAKDQLTREEQVKASAMLSPIDDFIKRIAEFKAANGVTETYIEHKLAINAAHEPVDFFDKSSLLRGVLDLGMRMPDDGLILIDHKSGKKRPMEEHATQFYCYMFMALCCFPWVTGVQCGINYVGEPRLHWFPRYDRSSGPWTRAEITRVVGPWLQRYLNRTAAKLTLIENNAVVPEPNRLCDYCGHLDQCERGTKEVEKRALRRKGSGRVGF